MIYVVKLCWQRTNDNFFFCFLDPKWKQFSSAIDRALSVWDSVEEWADYISFLGKLLKALKNGSGNKHNDIPYGSVVSCRLSQCLQPGLPSGVHQKTLEVYSTIFSMLGSERLLSELSVWLPGILPLMTHASINVKPHLIALYQDYILTLPQLPRYVIKPLLVALLPGIDDESSETFEEVFKLLDDIKLKLNDDTQFWACFFLVVISSPDRRLGALIWASRRLPKFGVQDYTQYEQSKNADTDNKKYTYARQSMSYEAQMATGPDPGLLIRAFCRGLEDEQTLVQRGFLELLVKKLELQSIVLQVLAHSKDLELLLVSVCSTVLRRDMSLNRRLWNWLLGPDPTETENQNSISREEYFSNYALEPLVNGILKMLSNIHNADTTTAERIKPFKICLSILDRWEVGGAVIPRVLVPSIRAVKDYANNDHADDKDDVVRSISTFIDGVEAVHIWHDIVQLIRSGEEKDLHLVLFILETFNVNEEEMIVTHIPLALLVLFSMFKESDIWFQVCCTMLDYIPDRAYLPIESNEEEEEEGTVDVDSVSLDIWNAYSQNQREDFQSPVSASILSHVVLSKLAELLAKSLNKSNNYLEERVAQLCEMLNQALEKIPHTEKWKYRPLIHSLLNSDDTQNLLTKTIPLFITISGGMSENEVDQMVNKTLKQLWEGLITHSSFSTSDHHVKMVRGVWLIHELLLLKDPRRVESILATLFIDEVDYSPIERARAFSALWYHSADRGSNCSEILLRTLYLMLDRLADSEEDGEWHSLVSHWLDVVVSSKTTDTLLSIVIGQCIESSEFLTNTGNVLHDSDDLEMFVYHIQTLTQVVTTHEGLLYDFFFLQESIPHLKSISQLLINFFHVKIPTSPSGYKSHKLALEASVNFLETVVKNVTNIPETENGSDLLSDLIDVLLLFLQDKNNAMGQIGVLRLLSECLQKQVHSEHKPLPKNLVQCLIDGLSNDWNEFITEKWVSLLTDTLPLFDESLLQVLIPLVECLCAQITKTFEQIKSSDATGNGHPQSFYSYMNGVEYLLVTAHHKLMLEEANFPTSSPTATATNGSANQSYTVSNPTRSPNPNSETSTYQSSSQQQIHHQQTPQTPQQQSGFFGNVMSGVFTVESPLARSTAANNRLTVLLCFQDVINVCFDIWQWVNSNSSVTPGVENGPFLSSRLRSRTRKLMIKLYKLEPLETLECLMELNYKQPTVHKNLVHKIIHVLDGSRPKVTVPHLFESVTSRTSSHSNNASEPTEKSTSSTTTALSIHEVMEFTVEYLQSLEHDAIEEIWHECIGFIREVQNNQSLYKPVLALTLKFIGMIAYKVDQVKFGEQRKIRKDLADLFTRLLNFTLTTRLDENDTSSEEGNNSSNTELSSILKEVVPKLRSILVDTDKVHTALSNMMVNMIVPASKSKNFPKIFSQELLSLLNTIMDFPQGQRAWKSIIGDLVFEQRFMNMSSPQAKEWKPVIKRWVQFDKERVKDYVNRLNTSSPVVLFTSSDERNVKKQNLNRLAYIILAGSEFMFISIQDLASRFEELLTQSPEVIAEVFTCFRSLVLRVESQQLAPLWTLVYTHLIYTFQELRNDKTKELKIVLSACKLLDMLLCVGPEDFRLQEWLFITDNMDAIFRDDSSDAEPPAGIIDQVSTQGIITATETPTEMVSYGGL